MSSLFTCSRVERGNSRKLRTAALLCTVGCVFVLSGCPGTTSVPATDSGSIVDAGSLADGATPDSGTTLDGSATPDGSTTPDSGTTPDAAITDAGSEQLVLSVVLAGTGMGTVTSSPSGIDCGSDCSEPFDAGTVVTLTAAPDAGSTFMGWSGGGCTGTGSCVATVTAVTAVAATFTLTTQTLDVSRGGTGAGTVTSSPAGIDCGVDCTEGYPYGTIVTLTAAPTVGSMFLGWSGGGCSGTGTCTTTIIAATAVTATFSLTTFTLAVARAGTGSGTVTSNPAGIACGADCTEDYAFGTVVMLTAAPAAGSTFTGWSGGGCTGTGSCTTPITAATTVTATFTLSTYTLSVARAGTGTGTVTSSPAGIACGVDCTEDYGFGTGVVLTAVSAAGSTFAGWSGGGCSGTGTCTTTITAATTVTATFTFTCAGGSMTFGYTGAAQIFTVPACVTSITVDARGGSGGDGWNVDGGGTVRGFGGNGGRAEATLTVTAGEMLSLYVGGGGQNATPSGPGLGGFNGGGNGANSPFGYSGGGGGGATDIRRVGSALTDRILVAGGGGSGSGWCTSGAGNGGVGGGLIGASGADCVGMVGTGGTQTMGGTTNGVFGIGGSIGIAGGQAGSAGGGGWYGGGASNGSGGGGGSSYVVPTGSSSVTHTQGFQDGNGSITISW